MGEEHRNEEEIDQSPDAESGAEGTDPTPKPKLPKPAIAAIAVALLAGLGLGGAWLAGAFDQQPEQEPEVVAVDEPEAKDVVATVSIDAPNWVEGSSPFVVHFDGCCAATEDVDFYHAVSAGDPESASVELPAGRYEVGYISAVNPDGSIYETPEEPATVVIGEADTETPAEDATDDATASDDASADASEEQPTLDVDGSFEQVPAEDVTQGDIDGILGDLADAVEKGDETLAGDAGQQVVDTATGNAQNAPNVDKDEVEQAGEEASGAVAEEPAQETQPSQPSGSTGGNTGGSTGGNGSSSSKPSGGNGGSSSKPSGGNGGGSASKPSGGNSSSKPSGGSSSGGGSSQPSKPSHTHSWVAQTTVVHHEATGHYESVPVYGTVVYRHCTACGQELANDAAAWKEHSMAHIKSGVNCSFYTVSKQVQTGTEQKWVQDSAAWDETVTTGYKCSGCGATK